MSTMLSDKVEQVSGAAGGSPSEGNMSNENSGGEVRDELRKWKDEVLSAIKDDETWGVGSTGQGLGGGHYQTTEALTGVKQAVQADAEEMMHRVEDWVIDHPLKSLCVAAGVGFLLGVIWSH